MTFAVSPVLLYGAIKAFESNSNDIVDWLPQSFEETQRLFWFVERFGSDEILVISWDGCTLDDERLDRVAERLREPARHPRTGEEVRWFRNVYTGRQTFAELTTEQPFLTHEEALARMDGWLIGPDGQSTCVLAMVSDAGLYDRHGAITFVREAVAAAGVPCDETYIAGPTADSVAVDQTSNNRMVEMALLSAFVGILTAWLCLRDARLLTLIFACAGVAWGMSLSCLYFWGPGMDAVLLAMPGLVFVLTVSGGFHLTNYYKEALHDGPAADAPAEAIRRAWAPCTLAIVTTALGLGSLMTSQLTPIRRFGLFSSIGVMLSLLVLLVLWPSLAVWWPPKDRHITGPGAEQRPSAWWKPLYVTSVQHGRFWLALVVLSTPVCAWGVSRLETSVKLQDLFRANSQIVRSSEWMREHLGALIPVEIVLRFPRELDDRDTGMLQRALIAEKLRSEVAASPLFDSAVAATTFAPPLPDEEDGPQIIRRRLLAGRLPEYRERFVEFRLLRDEPHEELWRISARVNSATTDFGVLLASVDRQLAEFLENEVPPGMGVSAEVCGAVPLIHMAQQRLLHDLIVSYLVAFGLILVMMVVLIRGLAAGLLAMIPNVLPALVAFGLMGLLGMPIDIGTMMTASVAMGVAVDDTVHFLVWFRHGLQEGHSRRDAVRYAFTHCATPMFQSTAICGAGLLAFVFSPFVPVARFGLVMAFMLAVGLVGDLVILPVLLCSGLGRFFDPREKSEPPAVDFLQPVGATVEKL